MTQLTRLIDNVIVDADGRCVGSIDELILSTATGRISHLVIRCLDGARFCVSWCDVSICDERFVLKRSRLR